MYTIEEKNNYFLRRKYIRVYLVAERSKVRVCGRSLAVVASLNPAGGMDVCVVCVVSKDKRQNAGKSRRRNNYG
jgi:hypothetical protein